MVDCFGHVVSSPTSLTELTDMQVSNAEVRWSRGMDQNDMELWISSERPHPVYISANASRITLAFQRANLEKVPGKARTLQDNEDAKGKLV